MKTPTQRQLDVLKAIHEHCTDNSGLPPTLRWLCKKLNTTSTNGINAHLVLLERKGLITRQHEISRGLWLTNAGLQAIDALQDGLEDLIVEYENGEKDERLTRMLKELLRRRNGGNA